jgi:exodeoxyribonuclease-3
MKVLCWNIAGLRAALKKGALDFLVEGEWDVVCLQETKAEESQVQLPEALAARFPFRFWKSTKGTTQRKGLSGTAIWSRVPVLRELEPPAEDEEGRVTAVEFPFWNLVTVYTPNSQAPGAARNVHRVEVWDPLFRKYVQALNARKPTIVCGDFNVANEDIDVYQPEEWRNEVAGFLDQERRNLKALLATGLRDVFREQHPELEKAYTFWDQKLPYLRRCNRGWRIDYFLVPEVYRGRVKEAGVMQSVMGSDHCPITLDFEEKGKKLRVVESFG